MTVRDNEKVNIGMVPRISSRLTAVQDDPDGPPGQGRQQIAHYIFLNAIRS